MTIDQMPDHARLWIYQANRPFTAEEESEIERMTQDFIDQWAAHGQKLKAAFTIAHHQFLILSVDESFNQASGCSIDASVSLVRQIQNQFGIDLLDRTKIAFLIDGKVEVQHMSKLKSAIQEGKIGIETQVFNNLVETTGDWKSKWVQPAGSTWLNRYFSK